MDQHKFLTLRTVGLWQESQFPQPEVSKRKSPLVSFKSILSNFAVLQKGGQGPQFPNVSATNSQEDEENLWGHSDALKNMSGRDGCGLVLMGLHAQKCPTKTVVLKGIYKL